jgi:dihydropteroate synthase
VRVRPMTGAPPRELHARGRVLTLGAPIALMGVLNATPDSFSDALEERTLQARVAHARELLDAGARIIDVGGESNVTSRPAIDADEEIARVVPVIEHVVALGEDVVVSVDTYKPAVAEAAICAGASMVNDVSGLADPGLADVCASTGAALVIMHTRAAPKTKVLDPDLYDDIVADVLGFLRDRMELAGARGVPAERILLDPGPDFAKTPAQTIEVLSRLEELHVLGRPLLLAISRKDALGAITRRGPRERLAATLAALADGADRGAHVARVHDVRDAADFLAVRGALRGEVPVQRDLQLPESLRRVEPSDRLDG